MADFFIFVVVLLRSLASNDGGQPADGVRSDPEQCGRYAVGQLQVPLQKATQ